jgi:hypothetical protein
LLGFFLFSGGLGFLLFLTLIFKALLFFGFFLRFLLGR